MCRRWWGRGARAAGVGAAHRAAPNAPLELLDADELHAAPPTRRTCAASVRMPRRPSAARRLSPSYEATRGAWPHGTATAGASLNEARSVPPWSGDGALGIDPGYLRFAYRAPLASDGRGPPVVFLVRLTPRAPVWVLASVVGSINRNADLARSRLSNQNRNGSEMAAGTRFGTMAILHPHHSNGNSHIALGDRRSERTTAGSALGCARGRHPRLGLAVRCGDLALSQKNVYFCAFFTIFFTCSQNSSLRNKKAGPFGAAALQGSGDRGCRERGAPKRLAYAPCSPLVQ